MIIIREAAPSDLPALIRARNTPDLHRENLQRADGVNRRFLVCEADGNLIGFSQLLLRRQADAQQKIEFPKISDLYIVPSSRCQGLGSAFIREMEAIIQRLGYRRIYLGVDAENTRAVSLYKRLGYVALQEKPYARRAVFYEESGQIIERVYWRLDMAKDLSDCPTII